MIFIFILNIYFNLFQDLDLCESITTFLAAFDSLKLLSNCEVNYHVFSLQVPFTHISYAKPTIVSNLQFERDISFRSVQCNVLEDLRAHLLFLAPATKILQHPHQMCTQ